MWRRGAEPRHDDTVDLSVSERETRRPCTRCFNALIATQAGLESVHPVFEPLALEDAVGERHQFYFRVRHGGDHIALDAFELTEGSPGGYEFQILGDPEQDPAALFERLVQRMRRALARRHLEETRSGLQITKSRGRWIVRGQIGWDDDTDGRVPRLVIDGRGHSWDEIGRMLMTFEGFHIKMEVHDRSEER